MPTRRGLPPGLFHEASVEVGLQSGQKWVSLRRTEVLCRDNNVDCCVDDEIADSGKLQRSGSFGVAGGLAGLEG